MFAVGRGKDCCRSRGAGISWIVGVGVMVVLARSDEVADGLGVEDAVGSLCTRSPGVAVGMALIASRGVAVGNAPGTPRGVGVGAPFTDLVGVMVGNDTCSG